GAPFSSSATASPSYRPSGSAAPAAAIDLNLSVQSRPERVFSVALPFSTRNCSRYPSNLISCAQPEPGGGRSTERASWGGTNPGKAAALGLGGGGAARAAATGASASPRLEFQTSSAGRALRPVVMNGLGPFPRPAAISSIVRPEATEVSNSSAIWPDSPSAA